MKLSALPTILKQRLPFLSRQTRHAEHFQGVLGTSLEVQVLACSRADGHRAVLAALDEIDRLERVFSRFDPESELNRWLTDASLSASPELVALLRRAEEWRALTDGAFHPGSEALTQLWRVAERSGRPPLVDDLLSVAERLQLPVWSEEQGWRPATPLNLNAFAKGFIVDSAAQAAQAVAQQGGPAKVLVNIGGDLRHLSMSEQRGIAVDVMDPHAPFANAAPLTRLMLNQGLATSGGAFRGFVVAGQRFTHLLDPCSGQPVRQVVGATVLAPKCADADALATAFSVLDPAHSLALADRLPGVACLLVLEDGQQRRSSRFAALEVPIRQPRSKGGISPRATSVQATRPC